MSIDNYLKGVCEYVDRTNTLYDANFRNGIITHPMPFFGQIEQATVLTVGVNPSAEEFRDSRLWPQIITTDGLRQRLQNYFSHSAVEPHPWFKAWQKAMLVLNQTYEGSSVAHLDLSPRATIAMRQANKKLFHDMVIEDIRYFFDVLPLCHKAKLMMIAGTATSSLYINECVQREAPKHGFVLRDKISRGSQGWVSYHRLSGQGINLPVFFCSSGPSRNAGKLLIDRVNQNQNRLSSYLV